MIFDSKEIGRTAFVNLFFLLCIEIEFAGIALFMRDLVCFKAGGIISTYLIYTCTQWSRTVELANDDVIGAGKTALEIRADRSNQNKEKIFAGRMNADLWAGSN